MEEEIRYSNMIGCRSYSLRLMQAMFSLNYMLIYKVYTTQYGLAFVWVRLNLYRCKIRSIVKCWYLVYEAEFRPSARIALRPRTSTQQRSIEHNPGRI